MFLSANTIKLYFYPVRNGFKLHKPTNKNLVRKDVKLKKGYSNDTTRNLHNTR